MAEERYFQQKKHLETKAMTTSSHCNTGRMCVTLPIITRENTTLAVHVAQKITVIRAQKIGKIRGLKFDTLYWRHLAAYRKI